MANFRQTTSTNSSMIDLKAELFRKQEEYKQLKAEKTSDFVKAVKNKTNINKHGRGDIWSKKNAGVLDRASKDLSEKEEEDNVMERSRKALEAKSKIYDQIASASGIPDEDGSEGYLVDFQKKAVDRIVEQRRGEGKAKTASGDDKSSSLSTGDGSDDEVSNDEPIPLPTNPGEEWVDYVDTFGRSRRCLRKDLPDLQTQERPLGRPAGDGGLKLKEGATLLSADMKRELRRQQWEKETEKAMNGPVHYANVQYDEIRTHGTGYYQFSKDSNLREEQMDMLNKLREQTVDGRMRSERIKEKRKAAMEARLAKVKQRRKMKEGSLLAIDDKEEDEEKTTENTITKVTTEEPKESEPLTRDDSWRHTAPVREWDKGKEKLPEWNAKRYMEEKRSERESEFAPPQFYYDRRSSGPGGSFAERSTPATRARFGNPAGIAPAAQASSCTSGKTEAMFKEVQHSAGPLPKAVETVHQDVENRSASKTGAKLPGNIPANIDLATIPMPKMTPPEGGTRSSTSTKGEGRQETHQIVENFSTYGREIVPKTESVNMGQDQFQVQMPVQGHGYHSPVPDMSVPPPGWYPPQPQPLYPQPAPGSGPPSQSTLLSAGPPDSLAYTEQSQALSSFVYPSQRGLLGSQLQQPISQTVSSVQTSDTKPTVPKATDPKEAVVDKRFMQNKEVSDEDLLGYMAQASADPLANVHAVSYTPGSFSSSASSHVSAKLEQSANPETQAGESVTDIPAAQTEGVIFGVPDFVQPASDVSATTYQPGSFMAAKEAAAQRAEEEYEAARKKKQYSSAPVLYGKTVDSASNGQVGMDSATEMEKAKQSVACSEDDDEYNKFMKEVQGGK